MSVVGKPPKDLVVTGSSEDFERWINNFKNYLEVVEINATLNESQKTRFIIELLR